MPAIAVNPPFPLFTDADGQPLDDAYIYIGAANQNPVSNPITVYWDESLTIPASQPIRTSGGYPVYNGSPARFYANSDYSIIVRDKNGAFVYTAPKETDFTSSEFISFVQSGTGAVSRTAQSKLRDVVSVKDFGAVGDGVADDTVAIQAAITYCSSNKKRCFVPTGNYKITSQLTLNSASSFLFMEGDAAAYGTSTFHNYTALPMLKIGNWATVHAVPDFVIKNISIANYNTNAYGLHLVNCYRTKTENFNISGQNGILIERCFDLFLSVHIEYCVDGIVSLDSVDNWDQLDIRIIDSTIRHCTGYAIKMYNIKNLIVDRCYIEDCTLGGIYAVRPASFTLKNSHFEANGGTLNNSRYDVHLPAIVSAHPWGTQNITIENNTITQYGLVSMYLAYGASNSVSNNQFISASGNTPSNSITLDPSGPTIFSGNYFASSALGPNVLGTYAYWVNNIDQRIYPSQRNDQIINVIGVTTTPSTTFPLPSIFGTYIINVGISSADREHSRFGTYLVTFENRTNDYSNVQIIGAQISKGGNAPTSMTVSVNSDGVVSVSGSCPSQNCIAIFGYNRITALV